MSELDVVIGRYIVDTYHHRVHPETGQAPIARWSAGDWMPQMPDSLEALDLLLLTVTTPRKVQRDGIHCHGLRYLSVTLAPYVGEPVTIRYDPRDLAEIRVYHRDKVPVPGRVSGDRLRHGLLAGPAIRAESAPS